MTANSKPMSNRKLIVIYALIIAFAYFILSVSIGDKGAEIAQCQIQAMDKCTKKDSEACVPDRVVMCMRAKGFDFVNSKECFQIELGGYSKDTCYSRHFFITGGMQ